MTNIILGAVICIGLFLTGLGVGINRERAYYQAELAKAKAAFELTIKEANEAYANQKVIDDAELVALKVMVENTPPNATIAIKKDMASRIGAVR